MQQIRRCDLCRRRAKWIIDFDLFLARASALCCGAHLECMLHGASVNAVRPVIFTRTAD